MKSLLILAAFSLGACAQGRTCMASPWEVSYFYAGINAGTTDNEYQFDIQTSPDTPAALCSAEETSDNGMFVDVPRKPCSDDSVSFSLGFGGASSGAVLEVWCGSARRTFGLPKCWFAFVTAAEVGSQELYMGPQNFSIPSVQVVQSCPPLLD